MRARTHTHTYTHTHTHTHVSYIKMNICMYVCIYVCMYVCLYLLQIHISAPIGTKLCTRLLRGLEETVGYVWAHNISPFPPLRTILRERVQIRAQYMAAVATLSRYYVISVMPRVLIWRHGRRWFVQWKRREVNEKRVCGNRNLMRREESD
jgi:hypothetical protein